MSEEPQNRDQPYEILGRTPLDGGHELQERIDYDRNGNLDHYNQDITGVPRDASRNVLGEDHQRPL